MIFTEIIQNELFYHIQKENISQVKFKLGETRLIGTTKNPFFATFDSIAVQDDIGTLLGEYVKFARETAFEEVRQKFFPDAPSRQTCIWLVPHGKPYLDYWLSRLNVSDKSYQILELRCSGKIFYANEKFLNPSVEGLNYFKVNAFRYWSGFDAEKSSLDVECLFQGFIHVEKILHTSDASSPTL